MIFGKKIPAGDIHLIQHRWKNLNKLEDIYKRLYEAYHLYQYAISKLKSIPKFKNQSELTEAINVINKINDVEDFTLTANIATTAISQFEKALIQLKILGKSKT